MADEAIADAKNELTDQWEYIEPADTSAWFAERLRAAVEMIKERYLSDELISGVEPGPLKWRAPRAQRLSPTTMPPRLPAASGRALGRLPQLTTARRHDLATIPRRTLPSRPRARSRAGPSRTNAAPSPEPAGRRPPPR